MSKKFSDWFPASVKPTIPGVYEFKGFGAPFHYWSGQHWVNWADGSPRDFGPSDKDREPMSEMITYHLTAEWRGLAEKPKARK